MADRTPLEPTPGNPKLIAHLREQITTHGPVTFKWFMQQALYHPEHGYYGGGRARIGRQGDFYTSVSVGRIFGELMAKQFEEIWYRMNSPAGFAIVEEGAHHGQFAQDVLGWLQQFSPDLYAQVRYWIVEPNPQVAGGAAGDAQRLAAQQDPLDQQSGHFRGGFALRRVLQQRTSRRVPGPSRDFQRRRVGGKLRRFDANRVSASSTARLPTASCARI